MMSDSNFVIGLDYGTDSVRAVLVDAGNGKTIATEVYYYARWKRGEYCDPSASRFRQHVRDYLEGLETTIRGVMTQSKVSPARVKGICIDTTGSSPVPVDEKGTALCMLPGFEENPNAMTILWKDHTAIQEADEINELARTWGGEDYTRFEGGIYSSEWFWAKILHVIREDKQVREAAFSWVEHCDLMTYILTGEGGLDGLKRSRCAAGHKAMWHEHWGGLPPEEFLGKLDPYLAVLRGRLYDRTYTSDEAAGTLSMEWARKLGLSEETVVSVGTFDAHAGAVGAEVKEKTLVRVMGTSTCDIIVSPNEVVQDRTVEGICGQVDGSVIPGMIGLEAGQSAFGDVLAWFRDVLMWPVRNMDSGITDEEKAELADNMIAALSEEASRLPVTGDDAVALDWINGRRTPDADQTLKAAISGLHIGSGAPAMFKSLVEAISFGSRKIVERFQREGVEIESIVGIGGVARKSDFVMQTLSDVLNMPIRIAVSDQAPALGAAMYAAAAAGIYGSVEEAIENMGNGIEKTYTPRPDMAEVYDGLYEKYDRLGRFVENDLNA